MKKEMVLQQLFEGKSANPERETNPYDFQYMINKYSYFNKSLTYSQHIA